MTDTERPRYRVRAPSVVTKAVEGEYRPGPWWLPVTQTWLPSDVGSYMNWWQLGYTPERSTRSALVEACISAYSQTVAMCPGDHWRATEDGGKERITTSALSRILRKPNDYQSISDFLLNAVRNLYLDGNAYVLCLRNDRFEVSEFHLMGSRESSAQVSVNGDVFYALGGNEVIESRMEWTRLLVPARDVLHLRLQTPRHPLLGESPLMAAAWDIAAGDAIAAQQIQFYTNMARPSTVLVTDLPLDADQMAMLRDRWNDQSRGMNAGGTPILSHGIKPQTISTNAEDSQLAEILKLTEQHIALAFRIPLQILGIGGAPFGSTELLMQSWIASGLGFCLNHIEEAIGQLFGLKGLPTEWCEFDTSALLRSAWKDRIDGLARAVQGGIMAPNEARASEGLKKVDFGDEPRLQQQVVPLSAAGAIPAAPGQPSPPPSPPVPAPNETPVTEAERGISDERLRRTFRSSHSRSTSVLPV